MLVAVAVVSGSGGYGRQESAGPFIGGATPLRIVEATIAELQAAMTKRRVTSREIVSRYLIRIALYENRLHAALAVNPRALEEADQLDRERAAGKIRGPLHGIPIALKDNIHTTDMPTTGGALAFAGLRAAVRSDAHEESARRGRDHHREDRVDRARQLGCRRADADARQLQRRRRLRVQSVRPAAGSARCDVRRQAGRCRPADRAPASAPRQASGPPASAPTPVARSSAPRTRTCSSASGRPSVASAATA